MSRYEIGAEQIEEIGRAVHRHVSGRATYSRVLISIVGEAPEQYLQVVLNRPDGLDVKSRTRIDIAAHAVGKGQGEALAEVIADLLAREYRKIA